LRVHSCTLPGGITTPISMLTAHLEGLSQHPYRFDQQKFS